ncbi:MAG: hypothetical protein KF787_00985 [Phycisphaeraceae bacterium]|nr:hypothetical protein [Phycisphaerae bacterium]MBX3391197.1 hypothetical protein [Phycisphaeraceae bacterium]
MMIFVLYAAIVWYAAARWRRTWWAFSAVTAGLLLIIGFILAQGWISQAIGFRLVGVMVNGLLYPFAALLGLVGYYIAVIPRPPGEGAQHPCEHCGYDLVGMEETDRGVCPECGKPFTNRSPSAGGPRPGNA